MAVATQHSRRLRPSEWLLHAGLALLSLLTLFPFIMMLMIASKDRAQLATRFWGLPDPIRWENFATGFSLTQTYIFNSIVVSGLATLLTLLCATLMAYAISQLRFPGRDIVWFTSISLLMVPGILVLVPLFLTVRSLGILNSYPGLILPQVAGSLPFALFLFRTFFDQLPRDLFASARIDGASELSVMLHIVLPLSKPIVSTVGVLTLLATWNNFVWPLVCVRDEELRTIPLGLVFLFTELNLSNFPNPGLEMAAYAVASVPMLICFFFALRTFLHGLTSGAIKG
jgi:ABC-type glycerol-3-phosphate transport system permease component